MEKKDIMLDVTILLREVRKRKYSFDDLKIINKLLLMPTNALLSYRNYLRNILDNKSEFNLKIIELDFFE